MRGGDFGRGVPGDGRVLFLVGLAGGAIGAALVAGLGLVLAALRGLAVMAGLGI
jgi:hypothetical protein